MTTNHVEHGNATFPGLPGRRRQSVERPEPSDAGRALDGQGIVKRCVSTAVKEEAVINDIGVIVEPHNQARGIDAKCCCVILAEGSSRVA
jgi:hypothetical protein